MDDVHRRMKPLEASAPDALGSPATAGFVAQLRDLAVGVLPNMYVPEEGRFVFRLRRAGGGTVAEGRSLRYTAITSIGLATQPPEVAREVLGGETLGSLCGRLASEAPRCDNLGDVALILWASAACGHGDVEAARARLRALQPERGPHPSVEIAWVLTALSVDAETWWEGLAERLADRLSAAAGTAGVFPHVLGASGLRSHVACFADMVYPILALSLHHGRGGRGIEAALRAAEVICQRQGPSGQWWWHYDTRTGRVLEGYPVYSVHQDSMAPMALLALQRASGHSYDGPLARGLEWLRSSPELDGGSLFDPDARTLWRKVARREPGKLARTLQAGVSRLHPRLRVPFTDTVLPPTSIDHELRPYHLGWVLYAFPPGAAKDQVREGR